MGFKEGDILRVDTNEGRKCVFLNTYGTVCPISHERGVEFRSDSVELEPSKTGGYAVCGKAYEADLEKLNAEYVETVPETVLDEVDMMIAGLNCPEGMFIE